MQPDFDIFIVALGFCCMANSCATGWAAAALATFTSAATSAKASIAR
jgi:hypothetical protein